MKAVILLHKAPPLQALIFRLLTTHSLYLVIFFSFHFVLFTHFSLFAQTDNEYFSIVSFNVENFFDTIPQKTKADLDFLPDGSRKWTKKRFYQKSHLLSEAISIAGGLSWPWFVALQEIESETALRTLLHATNLRNASYKYIISTNHDARGIRIAFLYLEGIFRVSHTEEWQTPAPIQEPSLSSRPILYAEGKLRNDQGIGFIIVHLPSKRLANREKELFRENALSLLKEKCDSLYTSDPHRLLIVIGDFNTALKKGGEDPLAKGFTGSSECFSRASLYDISNDYSNESYPGSYYFRRTWSQIDRIMLIGSILDPKSNSTVRYIEGSFTNVALPGRMKKLSNGRYIPLRTYGGENYLGGTSDHLPIRANFFITREEKSK